MTSRAIKDYFGSFGLKKIKEFSSANFMLYIWLIVGPWQFVQDGAYATEAYIIYYTGVAVFIPAMSGIANNPVGLPKLMHLLPMNESMRRDYIKARFWVRFFAPAALFVILRLILWIIFPQNVFYLLFDGIFLMGLLGGCFMSVTGVNLALEASTRQPKLLKEEQMKGMDVKGLFAFLIGIVLWFLSTAGISSGGKIPVVIWVVGIFMFLLQLLLCVKMVSYVKYLIPLASDYERMYV